MPLGWVTRKPLQSNIIQLSGHFTPSFRDFCFCVFHVVSDLFLSCTILFIVGLDMIKTYWNILTRLNPSSLVLLYPISDPGFSIGPLIFGTFHIRGRDYKKWGGRWSYELSFLFPHENDLVKNLHVSTDYHLAICKFCYGKLRVLIIWKGKFTWKRIIFPSCIKLPLIPLIMILKQWPVNTGS